MDENEDKRLAEEEPEGTPGEEHENEQDETNAEQSAGIAELKADIAAINDKIDGIIATIATLTVTGEDEPGDDEDDEVYPDLSDLMGD